ncbi:uncharacterized protein PG998_001044 [Apiospora kogelbergensis]|uniref:uncharacterized protein n=1 Tax=Apiospora kogelbergensis TaxID=1337665 RepID=UPI0031320770
MDTANMSTQELQLCQHLIELPQRHGYRYTDAASRDLLSNLFWSMAGGKPEYMRLLFPEGKIPSTGDLKLSEAQGAIDGAEYTEAARGKACGHIFRAGEATYSCKTCGADETCCLCSKCFDSTDHRGHMVRISISPGNSGCCDCGDPEAWKRPLYCTIHTEREGKDKGKGKEAAGLPEPLLNNIRMTVARAIDFICDVVSCAPEQLRQPKTKTSIEQDEKMSRLNSTYCGGDIDSPGEFSVILWNDEKHTVVEVQEQVARACRMSSADGYQKAHETDNMGRSILIYHQDISHLLDVAKILEQIKVTVTIRSSRDTFREQMCGSMVSWLNDVAGCSPAIHASLTNISIEDEEKLEYQHYQRETARLFVTRARMMAFADATGTLPVGITAMPRNLAALLDDSDDDDEDDGETPPSAEEDNDISDDDDDGDVMMIDAGAGAAGDVNMSDWRQNPIGEALEEEEATIAGYPPPPPPPPVPRRNARDRDLTPSDSDTAEPLIAPTVYAKVNLEVPKTPGHAKADKADPPRPGRYWVETPAAYLENVDSRPYEDVFERVRLDWLILFDLRLWKKVRNDLRALYISTVVTIPEFKRILGLRFAALYTTLAQLYLIGDREPDHSIINISLQMLTAPSITAEVVERGNFLTTLMAILYTFLTNRQVGHPWDVSSSAVLGFDTGSVTNRRMYHFYVDMRYLFSSPHVQERMRTEERYLLQFLDLVKLHQGICPNVRAIGEHVEYETDTWIGASLMTREMNQLCRMLADSFRKVPDHDLQCIPRAIRLMAKSVIVSSIGAERARFTQAEVKDEVRFKTLTDFEFAGESTKFDVVKFVVEEQPISFHHALHYTLSWLIECGKDMSAQELASVLSFTAQELKMKPKTMGRKTLPRREYGPEDYLMAAFDYPLRVCVWLAQIKAGMWVRNGISLRHQAITYRNILHRNVTHHRDIFLLQTALVICDPSRVLASIVDRFGMESWVKGFFEQCSSAQDDVQHLDVIEDMVHLLIVLLSDRTSLVTQDEREMQLMAMRRDISHVLCFKPLSFNEVCTKLPDKFHEQEDFQQVLDEVATFKAPEGSHYNKNQREESEAAYRNWISKKTNKPVEDVVYEPHLQPIESGAFTRLATFTTTGMFAQIVYYSLLYPLVATKLTPKVPYTRVETFVQVVLHLVLIAISEDQTTEYNASTETSFVYRALTSQGRSNFMPEAPAAKTIVSLLELLSAKEELKACHPKINLILKRMRQKLPAHFDTAYTRLGIPIDRIDTASPASAHFAEEEREKKKKAALDRQAKVMAQFQQQQKSFLELQGDIDWGDEDLDDMGDEQTVEERKNFWKYPRGTCILCQEDTDDGRLYGTFGLFMESHILRQTDFQDADFVREAAQTPENLDRSAEDIRPFGLAHENRVAIEKINSAGETFVTEKQGLGKGVPAKLSRPGPVAVSCGHIMHFSCFEMYTEATARRHVHQIARHHPESLERLEFVCPLCKALGNAFLPISWDGKEESYPGELQSQDGFASFLDYHMDSLVEGSSQLVMDSWNVSRPPSVTVSTPFSDAFSSVATPESSVRSGSPSDAQNGDKELMSAYRRLRDTLRNNKLYPGPEGEEKDDELVGGGAMARTVGYTISATEIQQRGLEAQYGMTLIEKIPEQALIQLRILSETTSSYISIGGLRNGGDNQMEADFRKDSERQHCQLFISEYFERDSSNSRQPAETHPPLLSQDPFIFMCECVFGVAAAHNIDITDLVRLCYFAEIVKVVYNISRNIPIGKWLEIMGNRSPEDTTLNNFANFCHAVTLAGINSNCEDPEISDDLPNAGFDQPAFESLSSFHVFVQRYALAFLRKTAILLHVHFGVDLNSYVPTAPELDELSRLTAAMRLPAFDEMCTALTPLGTEYGWPKQMERLAQGWIKHQIVFRSQTPVDNSLEAPHRLPSSAQVSHPGIFELIGLPKNFDTLIEECARRRCPKTGRDLADPIVCLMCGEIFCGQTMCQRNMGIFINIRKCAIFYLHRKSGSFSNAPYIDKYGEVDVGLRHGRQLFLNQRRYDSMIRAMWLGHGVPSFISRKLEADINNGGWETI